MMDKIWRERAVLNRGTEGRLGTPSTGREGRVSTPRTRLEGRRLLVVAGTENVLAIF